MLNIDACANYISSIGEFSETEARLYCADDPSFERSLKEDILSEYYLSSEVEQMINNSIIKINTFTPVKDVVIPEKINGVTVTKIGESAFADSDLHTVEIPNTVTEIDDFAFYDNLLLYNIVNKTGRSFDWSDVFGNNSSDYSNDFIVGDYKKNNFYNVLAFFIKITSSPIDKIDFDKMILIEDMGFGVQSVTLKDSMGYEIYYNDLFTLDEWQEFRVGSKVEAKSCNPVLIKILKDNNVIFIGSVAYMICEE